MYAGRFAPSPTGPLHFGSLVAALASWLDARAAGGRWSVRIEDLDAPRAQPGATSQILRTLEGFGLGWDGEVRYQSARTARYAAALAQLAGRTYACGCSRREIADSALGLAADGAQIYPGTCRAGLPPGRVARAIRLDTRGQAIEFVDRVQGRQRQDLEREVGDFVLLRADGQFAYQLAVVVDDARQDITHVVRGSDLLASTPRQIWLQKRLGFATPAYLHHPVAILANGEKLSKQSGAPPLPSQPLPALLQAWSFLGQREPPEAPRSVAEFWAWATRHWTPAKLPPVAMLPVPAPGRLAV